MTFAPGIEDRVVTAMKPFGFTATDARIYLSLLKQHPATGYEVAARSGVPRSAIYATLKRLEGMGIVNAVPGKPARHVPLPVDRLLAQLESRLRLGLGELKTTLEQLSSRGPEVSTWTVHGYAATLAQCEMLIAQSREALFASLWAREALQLAPALRAATGRGVDVVLFSFNPLPDGLGEVCSYGLPETALEGDWRHKVILLADRRRLLVGGAERTDENRAVVTDEEALVEIALNNLILDITLFGERRDVDTTAVVSRLTSHMAPVDELLASS
jgi:HTH-type transcriptional regulator, sugar sensing transcriptional regulator